LRRDTVTKDVVVAGFLDRIEPAAETADLIVFVVRVAEAGGQIVAFDGLDPLAHRSNLARRLDTRMALA
jgi:hypothetical protein